MTAWREKAERCLNLRAHYYNLALCGEWDSEAFQESSKLRRELIAEDLMDWHGNPIWARINQRDRDEALIKEKEDGL